MSDLEIFYSCVSSFAKRFKGKDSRERLTCNDFIDWMKILQKAYPRVICTVPTVKEIKDFRKDIKSMISKFYNASLSHLKHKIPQIVFEPTLESIETSQFVLLSSDLEFVLKRFEVSIDLKYLNWFRNLFPSQFRGPNPTRKFIDSKLELLKNLLARKRSVEVAVDWTTAEGMLLLNEFAEIIDIGDKSDASFSVFNPAGYEVSFPFFQNDGKLFLPLLERDDVLREVNRTANNIVPQQKFRPTMIISTKGMGKTFFMRMLGSQKVPDHLKCEAIEEAIKCGRVISFDFSQEFEFVTDADISLFLIKLLIYHLCNIFQGCIVDGIHFVKPTFPHFRGTKDSFIAWENQRYSEDVKSMVCEYIRLTNLAFGVNCSVLPVFLFDEVQVLCKETSRISSQGYHYTLLATILNQLSFDTDIVCVCSGLNHGNIDLILDYSRIEPQIVALTAFSEPRVFWKHMLEYLNLKKNVSIKMDAYDADKLLIDCLISSSFFVPRLLYIAVKEWFLHRLTDSHPEVCFYKFESDAWSYYKEAVEVLKRMNISDISYLILSCGVRNVVTKLRATVPGTNMTWSFVISKSLAFLQKDGCFVFPFRLFFQRSEESNQEIVKIETQVHKHCELLVPGLDIYDIFISGNDRHLETYENLSMAFEKLFVASIAVKYFLVSKKIKKIRFSDIYDFGHHEHRCSEILKNIPVNLENGIIKSVEKNMQDYRIIYNSIRRSICVSGVLPVVFGNYSKLDTDTGIAIKLFIENRFKVGDTKDSPCELSAFFIDGAGVCNSVSWKVLKTSLSYTYR
jgi:hypothetical protein